MLAIRSPLFTNIAVLMLLHCLFRSFPGFHCFMCTLPGFICQNRLTYSDQMPTKQDSTRDAQPAISFCAFEVGQKQQRLPLLHHLFFPLLVTSPILACPNLVHKLREV
ncbi:hypothetical protein BKA93DRAFT_787363 [Sparassis latifolia]